MDEYPYLPVKTPDGHAVRFTSREDGEVVVSESDTATWQPDDETAWRDLELSSGVAQAICQSVGNLLDLSGYFEQKVADLDAATASVRETPKDDVTRTIQGQVAQHYVEETQPHEQVRQGVLYPAGDVRVCLRDDGLSYVQSAQQKEWAQVELPEPFKRIIRVAVDHALMKYHRVLQALRELDPALANELAP
jgi:hypothetical protein